MLLNNILEAIGNTPTVRLSSIEKEVRFEANKKKKNHILLSGNKFMIYVLLFFPNVLFNQVRPANSVMATLA